MSNEEDLRRIVRSEIELANEVNRRREVLWSCGKEYVEIGYRGIWLIRDPLKWGKFVEKKLRAEFPDYFKDEP